MHCASCGSDHLVAIKLTISSERVSMYRCPRCDSRTWEGSDGEMSRDRVLDLVRSSR